MNLFEFPEICEDCFTKYSPNLQYEIIPIDRGVITYYYLYLDHVLNARQRAYLSRHWTILFKELLRINEPETTIIMIDREMIESLKRTLFLLQQFSQLTFVSLVRCNLDGFMIFS